jgi:hypothetical protein
VRVVLEVEDPQGLRHAVRHRAGVR